MALDIAKQSLKGSLILFASNLTATLVSVVALILVARMLGPSDYGTYTIALLIPSLLQLLIGFGALPAVIRYAAYYNSIGQQDEAKRFTTNVIVFLGLTGTILSIVCLVLAGSLSALILHRPSLGPYVQLASLSVLGTTALQTATMSAIGWNWISLAGSTTVIQAIVKVVLSPTLILLGFGVAGALVGNLSSLFVAGVAGVSILYFKRLRGFGELGNFLSDVRRMIAFGLPIYAGSVAFGLSSNFLLLILAAIANNTVYGFYQAAVNFISPITLLESALVSTLFPAFASIDGIKADVNQAYRYAYRFVAFLLTPLIMFLIVSAGPLVRIIYGATYSGSVPYLQLLAFSLLPIAFGGSVHPAFFNGFGKPKLTLLLVLTWSSVQAFTAPILALTLGLGVNGLIYGIFLSSFVAWAFGTVLAFRFLHAALDVRSTATILLVSVIASFAVQLLTPTGPALATLMVNFVVFFGIYMTLAPLLNAITLQDVDIIELTVSEPAFIMRIGSPVLRYERLLVSLRRRGKQTIEKE